MTQQSNIHGQQCSAAGPSKLMSSLLTAPCQARRAMPAAQRCGRVPQKLQQEQGLNLGPTHLGLVMRTLLSQRILIVAWGLGHCHIGAWQAVSQLHQQLQKQLHLSHAEAWVVSKHQVRTTETMAVNMLTTTVETRALTSPNDKPKVAISNVVLYVTLNGLP